MLVLSRKKSERIRIGDEVTICVVEIRGDKVRIGVDAPPDVSVHREEVFQAIRAAGGNWCFAHLWDGERYLGPTKCATKRAAQKAVAVHTDAHAGHWGLVTQSEERPQVTPNDLR